MTEAEKLSTIKTLLGVSDESQDDRLTAYLTLSGKEILAWRYAEREGAPLDVPTEYESTQVFAVVAGYSQSGAENQTIHRENGISRTFVYADMVSYIRSHVTPLVGVM